MFDDKEAKPARRLDLLTGALLGMPALFSLLLILHHPTLNGVRGSAAVAQRIHDTATLDGLVHGGLMLLYGVQALGFYLFSATLGWRRPAVVAAFMAYAASVIVLIIPATLDGFVTPEIIAQCLASPVGCTEIERTAFPIIGVMIGDFTKVALVATAIATLLWAFILLFLRGLPIRSAGFAGLLCGGVPIFIIVFSTIRLQPENLAGAVLSQMIWGLIAGALMVSGAIRTDSRSETPERLND